jgi:hypothetical protein
MPSLTIKNQSLMMKSVTADARVCQAQKRGTRGIWVYVDNKITCTMRSLYPPQQFTNSTITSQQNLFKVSEEVPQR